MLARCFCDLVPAGAVAAASDANPTGRWRYRRAKTKTCGIKSKDSLVAQRNVSFSPECGGGSHGAPRHLSPREKEIIAEHAQLIDVSCRSLI